MTQLTDALYDETVDLLERTMGPLQRDWVDALSAARIQETDIGGVEYSGPQRQFIRRLVNTLSPADLVRVLRVQSVGHDHQTRLARICYQLLAHQQQRAVKERGRRAHDAFASCHVADEALVARVCDALRAQQVRVTLATWTDSEGPYWDAGLERMVDARSVLVFVSARGLGPWQSAHPAEALARQYHSSGTVLPVALPGLPDLQFPPGLSPNLWVTINDPADPVSVDCLVKGIMGEDEVAATTTATSRHRDRAGRTSEMALEIARALPDTTFFVGRGSLVDERGFPHTNAGVSKRLLERLGLIDAQYHALLPSVDEASTWYSIGGDSDLEVELQAAFKSGQSAITPLYSSVADLVARSLEYRLPRGDKRSRPIVFTTNLDLLCELELLRAAVPFVRVVQCLERTGDGISVRFSVGAFFVKRRGTLLELASPDAPATVLVEQDDLDGIEHAIREGCYQSVSGDDMERILARYDQEFTRRIDEPAGTRRPAMPLLYKYLGSQDVHESCILGRADYIGLAQLVGQHRPVPATVKAELAKGPCVFLGFSLLDPDFMVLFETLVRPLFQVTFGNFRRPQVRVAPVQLPQSGDISAVQPMESKRWSRVEDALRRLSIEVLHEHPVTFLNDVSGHAALLLHHGPSDVSGVRKG